MLILGFPVKHPRVTERDRYGIKMNQQGTLLTRSINWAREERLESMLTIATLVFIQEFRPRFVISVSASRRETLVLINNYRKWGVLFACVTDLQREQRERERGGGGGRARERERERERNRDRDRERELELELENFI